MGCVAVKATCKKYDEARVHLKEAERTLVTIEGQVASDMLKGWKDEERVWLVKVVDMKEHERLSNPYEPRKEAGKVSLEAGTPYRSDDTRQEFRKRRRCRCCRRATRQDSHWSRKVWWGQSVKVLN